MMKLLSGSQGLVNAAGGQATAANCAYVIIFARGTDDNGEPFLLTDGIGVGYGGRPDSDGIDAVYYVAQENYPAEMVEMSYPARLRAYASFNDSRPLTGRPFDLIGRGYFAILIAIVTVGVVDEPLHPVEISLHQGHRTP